MCLCQDPITELTYDSIAKGYYNYELTKPELSHKYAMAYLTKAKSHKDSIHIIHGYYFLSTSNLRNELSVVYADSIILKMKDQYDRYYPTYAYINKASYYYNIGKYNLALDNYLLAYEFAKKTRFEVLENKMKNSIGVIKGQLGENKSALILLKQCVEYFRKKGHVHEEISSLFALADSYKRNNYLDSCTYINILGYKLSAKNGDYKKKYFVLNEGANQVLKENYAVALDSLYKTLPEFTISKDKGNLSILYYNLGRAYKGLKKKDSSIFYLKKMDSIVMQTLDISNDVRPGYEILIDYFESKDSVKEQLLFVKKLLRFDSISHSNYKYLNNEIYKKYDTPELIKEKESLIAKLNIDKQSSILKIIGLIIIIIIVSLFLIYNYRKRKLYEKRFLELTREDNKKLKLSSKKRAHKAESNINIPQEIVDSIIKKLESFEINNEFTASDITRESLAQKFGTNSKYISKTINHYKGKNFRNYINELRINYIVKELKVDKNLRKYTIKSISEELGYKSSESFTAAFKRITGIQFSYFINKINEKK